MNFLDIGALAIILLGAYKGYKHGLISSAISLVGTILVFVAAFYLKNPLSTVLYENCPFFDIGGIFKGVSSFNILLYEGIAYVICISVLIGILKVILKLTGIVDKLINLTVILALPNKLLGLIIGALEALVYVFVILFVMMQIPYTTKYFKDSVVSTKIVKETPILSIATKDLYKSVDEIYNICDEYKNSEDRDKVNYDVLNTLLKYDIVSTDSVIKLKNSGKLKIENIDTLISEYEKGGKND